MVGYVVTQRRRGQSAARSLNLFVRCHRPNPKDQMQLPNLPTDNLYKFTALAGITITLFSVALPVAGILRTEELLRLAAERTDSISIALSYLEADAERLRADTPNIPDSATLEARGGRLPPRAPGRPSAQALITEADSITQRTMRLRFAHNSAAHRMKEVRALYQQTLLLIVLGIVGCAIGIAMAQWGFRAWYNRVQRYQDALLKKQAADGI